MKAGIVQKNIQQYVSDRGLIEWYNIMTKVFIIFWQSERLEKLENKTKKFPSGSEHFWVCNRRFKLSIGPTQNAEIFTVAPALSTDVQYLLLSEYINS